MKSRCRFCVVGVLVCVTLTLSACGTEVSRTQVTSPAEQPSVSQTGTADSTPLRLRGLEVSLESNDDSITTDDLVLRDDPKGEYDLVQYSVTARNSTDATITDVSTWRNIPQLTDAAGQRVDFVSATFLSDGVPSYKRGGPGVEADVETEPGIYPDGQMTAVLTYQLRRGEPYLLTWMIGPDRVAKFEVP